MLVNVECSRLGAKGSRYISARGAVPGAGTGARTGCLSLAAFVAWSRARWQPLGRACRPGAHFYLLCRRQRSSSRRHLGRPQSTRICLAFIGMAWVILQCSITDGAPAMALGPTRPRRRARAQKGEADRCRGHDRARDTVTPDSSETSLTAGTVLTFIAMILLCMAVVVGLCLRLAEMLEPTVGDIADFSSQHASQDVLPVNVTAKAAGHTCVLASDVMMRGGGSFVIVARQSTTDGAYLIHWAGCIPATARRTAAVRPICSCPSATCWAWPARPAVSASIWVDPRRRRRLSPGTRLVLAGTRGD